MSTSRRPHFAACGSRALRTLTCVSLATALVTGCQKKTDDSAGQGAAPETAAAPGDAPKVAPEPVSPGASAGAHDDQFPTKVPTFKHGEGVYGHVVLHDVSGLLAELGQAAPPVHKGKFDEAALRALAAMALEQRGVLAQNINLKATMGCALLDFEKFPDAPTACAVGYKDGAEGLVRDLGEAGKLPDAKGHAAAYDLQGSTLYIDDLGTHVGLSTYETAFSTARGYLLANVVERAPAPTANVEATLFVKELAARYPEKLEPLLKELDNNAEVTAESQLELAKALMPDDPKGQQELADALVKLQNGGANGAGGAAGLRETLTTSAQATFTLGLDGWGLHVAGGVVPAEGSKLLESAKLADGVASRDLAARAPAGADALLAAYASPASWRSAPMSEGIEASCAVWTVLTSAADSSACMATLTTLNEKLEASSTGQSVIVHVAEDEGLFGRIGVLMETKKNRRDLFTSYASKVTSAGLLGPQLAKYLDFKFEQDLRDRNGAAIDRVTLTPTDAAWERLRADLSDKEWSEAQQILPKSLVIDRAELDGLIVVHMGTSAADAVTDQFVDAASGKGPRIDPAQLGRLFDHHPSAQTVGGLDTKVIFAFLARLAELDPSDEAAKTVGAFASSNFDTDLSTIRVYTELLPSGTGAFQVVLDQAFLGSAIERGMNLSQGGGAGAPAPAGAPPIMP